MPTINNKKRPTLRHPTTPTAQTPVIGGFTPGAPPLNQSKNFMCRNDGKDKQKGNLDDSAYTGVDLQGSTLTLKSVSKAIATCTCTCNFGFSLWLVPM